MTTFRCYHKWRFIHDDLQHNFRRRSLRYRKIQHWLDWLFHAVTDYLFLCFLKSRFISPGNIPGLDWITFSQVPANHLQIEIVVCGEKGEASQFSPIPFSLLEWATGNCCLLHGGLTCTDELLHVLFSNGASRSSLGQHSSLAVCGSSQRARWAFSCL